MKYIVYARQSRLPRSLEYKVGEVEHPEHNGAKKLARALVHEQKGQYWKLSRIENPLYNIGSRAGL